MDEATRMQNHYTKLRSFDERMTRRGFQRMFNERNEALAALLSRLGKPLSEYNILDFGCGSGRTSDWLCRHGALPERITGVDIQHDRIREARAAYPNLNFLETDGEHAPFPDNHFDIVLAFTVFSSILDPALQVTVAGEISRVLAKGGAIIWYDLRFPNPRNPNLRAMTLPRIRSLFPLLYPELETMTLLPPLAERLGPLTDTLYPHLAKLPMLRSHYFGRLYDRTVTMYRNDTQ